MAGGGLVTFECDGVITLTNTLTISTDTVVDGGTHGVTISGGGVSGIFSIESERRLTLLNLTLADGRANSGGAIRSAGGILTASNCVFRANIATSTNEAAGGAIYQLGGSLDFARCVFTGNRAMATAGGSTGTNGTNTSGGSGGIGWPASGGAIWNSGPASFRECYFYGNGSMGSAGGLGGGGGTQNFQCGPCPGFPGGSGGTGGSAAGGAIYHFEGSLQLAACTFASNSVTGGSGGIGGLGGAGTIGTYSAAGGSGGVGGLSIGAGIHAESGTVTATNNTWYANRATGGPGGPGGQGGPTCSGGSQGGLGGNALGGALSAMMAPAWLANNTLAQNAATGGSGGTGGVGVYCGGGVGIAPRGPSGGIGQGQGGGVASVGDFTTLRATIFAFNLGGNGVGPFIDDGFNISSDASLLLTNRGGWINLDPWLLALADNGGPTPTMALHPESPAIDHCVGGSGPAADQRGIARTSGLASDAGAYELEQMAGLIACDAEALRTSVAAGGVITPACDGVYRLNEPLVITSNTTIDASGRTMVLSGGRGTRVIHVNPGVALTLVHVTVQDGFSTNGAGIYNDGGMVTLVDCVVATNRAIGLPGINGTNAPQSGTSAQGGNAGAGTDGMGGGIYNTGFLRITNTAFLENRVRGGDGGAGGLGGNSSAMWDPYGRCRAYGPGGGGSGANGGSGLGGAIYNRGDAFIHNASVAGNHATGGNGGAGGSVGSAPCIITSPGGSGGDGGAASPGRGGAVYNLGRLELFACALFGNGAQGGNGGVGGAGLFGYAASGAPGISATANGGAIFNAGTNILVNVTVANNAARGGNCANAVGGAFDNSRRIFATNCTIWANTVTGGPATNGCSAPGGSLAASINTQIGAFTVLLNTIVGNPAYSSNCQGQILDAGHNICSDASASLSAPGSLNNTDPKLGPLADNGGPSRTIGLESGSPALDAGNSGRCPPTDQRGVSRPVGVTCDIGAFEGSDGYHYPKLFQAFAPALILAGTPATLQFTVVNPSSRTLSNIAITNRLPAQVVVARTPNVNAGCGGTLSASNGTITVALASLGPNQSCSFSVDVTSLISGTYTNVVDPVSSTEAGFAPTSASGVLVVDAPPVTVTGAASSRTVSSATLNGTVNPNGFATTAFFEFGSTTNYGRQTPMQAIGSGRGVVAFTNSIAGLLPSTGYHFRAVAVSALGTTFGQDRYLLTVGPGPGTGARLDGIDDFVTTPDMRGFFTNESVTIELWFRAKTGGTIVRERGTPPPQNAPLSAPIIEMTASGEVKVNVAGIQSVSLGRAEFDTWQHVVLRYDKATMNLDGFLNGMEADSDAKGDRNAPWEYGYAQFFTFGLGDWPSGPWVGFFRGELGEVRIWNSARTTDEIRANLYRRLTGSEPGLVCYWQFGEGMGLSTGDSSGHGNTGTFANGVSWVISTGLPIVVTMAATDTALDSATLNATVNPNGTEAAAFFEWGTTTNYGAQTSLQNIGGGVEDLSLSSGMAALSPASEYHYRVVASNSFGITRGKDELFFTSGLPPAGNALRLDGVDDFVITPDLRNAFSNESVTIELWVKPYGPGVIIDERGQLPPVIGWQDSQMEILPSGEIKVRVWNSRFLSLGPASFGEWHHAVLRYSHATATLHGFLDGRPTATNVIGGRIAPWTAGYGMHYAFGLADSASFGNGSFFKGEIDEVRIWSTVRSDQDICANRLQRLSGLEPGLICYWHFDEGSGQALDASGHGYHGSILNGAMRLPSTVPMRNPLVLTRLPDGKVAVDYLTCLAGLHVLQASTDLLHWTGIVTNAASINGSFHFIDAEAASHPWRFYRTVTP